MNPLTVIQAEMDAGRVHRVVMSLWMLRKLSNEPTYSVTLTWMADRDNGRGKGNSIMDALHHAMTGQVGLPQPRTEIEMLVNELRFHHVTVGISGMAPVDPKAAFFANARLNADDAPLIMGRGPDIITAIRSMK